MCVHVFDPQKQNPKQTVTDLQKKSCDTKMMFKDAVKSEQKSDVY